MESINSTKTRSRFGQPGSEGLKSEKSYTFAVAEWRLEIKKRKLGQSWFLSKFSHFSLIFSTFSRLSFRPRSNRDPLKRKLRRGLFPAGRRDQTCTHIWPETRKWVTTIFLVLKVSGSILTNRLSKLIWMCPNKVHRDFAHRKRS